MQSESVSQTILLIPSDSKKKVLVRLREVGHDHLYCRVMSDSNKRERLCSKSD